MLVVLVSNEYLQRDSYTIILATLLNIESPTYHLDHPPQTSFELLSRYKGPWAPRDSA